MPLHAGPSVSNAQQYDVEFLQAASAATFTEGAILVATAGEVNEGGTDPTGIVGIALGRARGNFGWSIADNNDAVNRVTFRENKVPVALATKNTRFAFLVVNASDTPVTPTQANVLVSYGLRRRADGAWAVDLSKTGATERVRITRILPSEGGSPTFVECYFLDASTALP